MGNIVNSTLAAAIGVGVQNVVFQASAQNVPRKQVIIGTYLAAKTGVVAETPVLSPSPAYTGDIFGLGSMLHRLHIANDLGAQGIETWIQPQAETGAAVAGVGEVDFTGTAGVLAGTLALYFSNIRVAVTVTDAMSIEDLTDACVAAMTAIPELPVNGAKHAVSFELDVTAKNLGTWGNDISISVNNLSSDVTPTGITVSLTPMASGAGLPAISTALDALGTGDAANSANFTALIHGYGSDATTLTSINTYVGAGDELSGLYSETVARPFRSLVGNVVAGAAGLTAVLAIGLLRIADRASGLIAVPDSLSNVHEIAAQATGHCERIANQRVAEGYTDIVLIGVDGGDVADRWTNEPITGRDIAVKGGIGTTFVEGETVVMKDVITFYHPVSTPVTSNGYREFVNISKLQNIMYNIKLNFSQTKWQGVIIVDDTNKVSSSVDREKARDAQAVKDDLVTLAKSFEKKAWIYQGAFTIDNITAEVREGADGFNTVFPVILSGLGKIYDNRVNFDTSIAILL